MDVTRRGFLGRAAAIVGALGLGVKAEAARVPLPPVPFPPPVSPVTASGFIPHRVLPQTVEYRAGKRILKGDYVYLNRGRLWPMDRSSKRQSIIGVAQDSASRGYAYPPGAMVTVLVAPTR